MSWELSLVFKSTVLLGGTLAALSFMTGMRASRRHLILASAFAALVALPVASARMPAVAISVPLADLPVAATADAPSLAAVSIAAPTPVRSASMGSTGRSRSERRGRRP